MAQNLAEKYSEKVDERFSHESYAANVTGNDYTFDGVDTVYVYSMPTTQMTDYNRHPASAVDRYGVPIDLQASRQCMKMNRDRSFTYIIDKGDNLQTLGIYDANRSLSRQINEVIIPEYDTYVFRTLAAKATAMGNISKTTPTKSNAYSLFLKGQEFMGNHVVPDEGRVAVCSYAYSNLLMQDPSFIRYGDASQQMLTKGVIGEVDGVKIMKVPSSRLPAGCNCILTHPYASIAPRQLLEYKIHDNPPGISGWKVEGRLIYDCFVLNNKVDGIYYIGGAAVLRVLNVRAALSAVNPGNYIPMVDPAPENGSTMYFRTGTTATEVEYGATIATDEWVALSEAGTEITPDEDDRLLEVVEVDANGKAVGYGKTFLSD